VVDAYNHITTDGGEGCVDVHSREMQNSTFEKQLFTSPADTTKPSVLEATFDAWVSCAGCPSGDPLFGFAEESRRLEVTSTAFFQEFLSQVNIEILELVEMGEYEPGYVQIKVAYIGKNVYKQIIFVNFTFPETPPPTTSSPTTQESLLPPSNPSSRPSSPFNPGSPSSLVQLDMLNPNSPNNPSSPSDTSRPSNPANPESPVQLPLLPPSDPKSPNSPVNLNSPVQLASHPPSDPSSPSNPVQLALRPPSDSNSPSNPVQLSFLPPSDPSSSPKNRASSVQLSPTSLLTDAKIPSNPVNP
jgi:hypothetical protein